MRESIKKAARLFFSAAVACAFMTACDDDESFAPTQGGDNPSSSGTEPGVSSATDNPALSSEALSSVVESSSSVAAPKTLCHISLVTKTGIEPMVVTTGVTSVCLPLENCDVEAVDMGFPPCYEDHATQEGCKASGSSAKVVEECNATFEKTCETPNGTAYMSGRLRASCPTIL